MKNYFKNQLQSNVSVMSYGGVRNESLQEEAYAVSPASAAVKRTFDIVCASVSLVLLSPVMLIIYIMIKAEDKGHAIFRQERIGHKGKPFVIYKFRSMVPDAEKDNKAVLAKEDDDRLTKVGRFLRRHHLDELPQLWNVLKGEMSFVGPRPERKCFIDKIMEHNPDYRYLYALRPGLFSEATLYNGYTDTMEKMLRRLDMDLEYLRNRTIFMDFKIIFLTAYSIISGKEF